MYSFPSHDNLLKCAFGDPALTASTPGTAAMPAPPTPAATMFAGIADAACHGHPADATDFQQARQPGDPLDAEVHERAARQSQRDRVHRMRVDTVLARLEAGDGVALFQPADPTGDHYCFRHDRGVLALRPHAAFCSGRDAGFELHLHGTGVQARYNGAWVEELDDGFFAALDTASRSAQQAFIL